MTRIDLYRYDTSCTDESVFLEDNHENVICPFCGSEDCLEVKFHWQGFAGRSVSIEVASHE